MPRTATVTPGKTSFSKEYLQDHPDASSREVNQAWTDAGMLGTISHSVISEVRRELGLIGKPRIKKRTAASTGSATSGKKRGRKPGNRTRQTSAIVAQTRVQEPTRTDALLSVEVEIDRLIFQIMSLGDLPEVEKALRSARRTVYQALSS